MSTTPLLPTSTPNYYNGPPPPQQPQHAPVYVYHQPPPIVPLAPPLPSQSFIYPLYGIPYLLTHRSLYPHLFSRIVPLLIVSTITITLFFTFLYIPHVILLALFGSPFPFSYAAFMILSESAGVVSILAESFLSEPKIIDVFDTVMLERTTGVGLRSGVEMVAKARVLERDVGTGAWRLGEHRKYPFLKFKESMQSTLLFLVELPLNLIPVFGTFLFIYLQGYHLGPLHHYHYFQLLGFSDDVRKEYIRQNRWKYTLFGITHLLLQHIPILNIFFLFSTGTGAALWASKAEIRRYEEAQEQQERIERAQGGYVGFPTP